MFWGDVHQGHENSNWKMASDAAQYCLDNNIYMIVTGDMLEVGTKTSIGDSVYTQDSPTGSQYFMVRDLLRPLAKKGLILSIHMGNHEMRIQNNVGIDVCAQLADDLSVPYGGHGGFAYLKVGNQSYDIYGYHGKSGAKTSDGKRKALRDTMNFIDADVYWMGHVHKCDFFTESYQRIDRRNRKDIDFEKYFALTGHSLFYRDSYAEAGGMNPHKAGFMLIELDGKERWVSGAPWPRDITKYRKFN